MKNKDIVWFAENVMSIKLNDNQKQLLKEYEYSKDDAILMAFARGSSRDFISDLILQYELWLSIKSADKGN